MFNNEKEISLIDLCLYILKKWKLMAIAAVTLAIVASGVTYLQSSKAYKTGMNAATEGPAPVEFTEQEEEAFQLKLESIEAYENMIADYEYYLANSIKANMNANKFYCGNLQYDFAVDSNEELTAVLALCESQVFSEEKYEELAGLLDSETDATLVKEVVIAEASEMTKYVITVKHFDEKDCETMLHFYEEQMNKIAEAEKVSGIVRTSSDSSLMNVRNDMIKAKTDASNTLKTLLSGLTEKEKAQYILLQGEMKETTAEISVPAPGVDVKIAVLAACAGVFCVAAFFGCIYLFDGRVHSKKEMESWLNLPIIETAKGDQMASVLLSGIASQSESKRVYVADEADAELKTMLADKGVEVIFGGDILKETEALQQMTACDSCVLVEKCFVSKENEIKEKIEKATACGVKVLAIVLEK